MYTTMIIVLLALLAINAAITGLVPWVYAVPNVVLALLSLREGLNEL